MKQVLKESITKKDFFILVFPNTSIVVNLSFKIAKKILFVKRRTNIPKLGLKPKCSDKSSVNSNSNALILKCKQFKVKMAFVNKVSFGLKLGIFFKVLMVCLTIAENSNNSTCKGKMERSN